MSFYHRHRPTSLMRCAANPYIRNLSLPLASFSRSSAGCLSPTRAYHAPWRPSSSPTYHECAPQTLILDAAMRHVSDLGFTQQSLARGAQDAGFLPVSTTLFGPFELVLFHLVQSRLALSSQAASQQVANNRDAVAHEVKRLLRARLLANAPIATKYSEAIALMSLAGNVPSSLVELWRLADDVWYLAGDKAVDGSWYAKRAALSGVYAATEVFMSQDTSTDFIETQQFLDRRLEGMYAAGETAGSVGQWMGFTASASVNVLRSWGVRI